jgi:hypothetical protein
MPWLKGPLPEGTWNWGGVVPVDSKGWGFHFADFHGDHVTICPGEKRLEANEVLYYNNALDMPPAPKFRDLKADEPKAQRFPEVKSEVKTEVKK